MNFGELLLNYRADHKLSQEKLAKLLDVTRATIILWEKGEIPRKVNELRIRKILEKGE